MRTRNFFFCFEDKAAHHNMSAHTTPQVPDSLTFLLVSHKIKWLLALLSLNFLTLRGAVEYRHFYRGLLINARCSVNTFDWRRLPISDKLSEFFMFHFFFC